MERESFKGDRFMPLFAIVARDKADHLQLRMDTREAHVEHLNSLGSRLLVAGPTLNVDRKPDGSLVVFEASDKESALAFADADPYSKAGLFERVDVRPYNALLGSWPNGDAGEEE